MKIRRRRLWKTWRIQMRGRDDDTDGCSKTGGRMNSRWKEKSFTDYINPVSPLPPSLSNPLFFQSFYRWKASSFSVNGLQSSELNIDFIGSLVTASVTTRCLLKNSLQMNAEPRREGWRRRGSQNRGNEKGERVFKRTTLKWKKGDREGYRKLRRETRRTQGGWEERTRDSASSN